MTEKQWYATDITTTAQNREAIEYGLMEAGALGTETVEEEDEVRVTGYFADPIDRDRVHRALVDAWRLYHDIPAETGRLNFKVRAVADRDWLAEWKKSWQPVQVGRFIIAPSWLAQPETDSVVIAIDPGMAFGTGTHETTRLCLKAIDRHYPGGSFLDVGTGTGVLAIAAAKMSQRDNQNSPRIEAYDTDAEAIEIAQENARVNGVTDRISFRVGTVDDQTPSADFVCANLTAPVILELLPALIGATCGRLVLSGILVSQSGMVQTRLVELGATDFAIDQDGEWVAIIV